MWKNLQKQNIDYEKICEMTGVERLKEFLRLQRLQWLRHVEKTFR